MTVAADKASLRASILARRRAMSPQARIAAGVAIARNVLILADPGADRTIASYVSIGTEPPTGELNDALRGLRVRVLLPVLRPDLDLDWAPYTGDVGLVSADRGLRHPGGTPLGQQAVAGADLVLVPALAVGLDGTRLGRGGGSYDRALARVPAGVPVVALLFDGELVERVPREPHDRRVTALVTPSGVRDFAGNRGQSPQKGPESPTERR